MSGREPPDITKVIAAFDSDSAPIIEAASRRLIAEGEPYDLELGLIRPDGERISVRVIGRPVIEHGRVVRVAGTISDVTDRRRAQEEIRTLNAELEQRVAQQTEELRASNEELEALVYSVSHDLRAPLRTMDSFSAMLLADYATQLCPAIVLPFAEATSNHRSKPMSEHSPSHDVIVQIKIKLLGVSKPPVWRQLQLRADTQLDHLHEMLVAAFGWQDYHMHCFTCGPEEFGVPDPELGFIDERDVSLDELIGDVADRLRYTYDFGDDWQHEIVLEDLLDADPDTHYPVLVAAKGAGPPEDCGGPWGYANLKAILADPNHDEHQDMLDWLGLASASEFDPAAVATDHIEGELALSGASR